MGDFVDQQPRFARQQDDIFADFATPYLERLLHKPDIYPESYSQTCFAGTFTPTMVLAPPGNVTWKRLIIDYAASARRRECLIVDVSVDTPTDSFPPGEVTMVDTASRILLMPFSFTLILKSLVDHGVLHKGGTLLTLSLTRQSGTALRVLSSKSHVCKELSRPVLKQEQQLLNHMRSNGCPIFLEGEIAVQQHVGHNLYMVWTRSIPCYQNIFPTIPTMAETPEKMHEVREYCNEVKFLNRMRDSSCIIQFHGIITDSFRTRLLGHLVERPAVKSMWWLLVALAAHHHVIPRALRESWCRQAIRGLLEIHRKGTVFGPFHLAHICIRADGTAALQPNYRARLKAFNYPGFIPPELGIHHDAAVSAHEFKKRSGASEGWTAAMDVYVLGVVLWSIMNGQPVRAARLCALEACTSFPSYACKDAHANPVQLPSPVQDGNSIMCSVIARCRAQDPADRASVEELWAMIEVVDDV